MNNEFSLEEQVLESSYAIATSPKLSQYSNIDKILKADSQLLKYFKNQLIRDATLSRQLVSFQGNKSEPKYRWYKYKEGFSAELVKRFALEHGFNKKTKILDPFSGSGATLFAASSVGIESTGIELLPIGYEIIKSRKILEQCFTDQDFQKLSEWVKKKPWLTTSERISVPTLKITKDAYPEKSLCELEQFIAASKNENANVRAILNFAVLCVLESISYTRKDGQYLRWDHRSKRTQGSKTFNKGKIYDFSEIVVEKLKQIIDDMQATNIFQNEPSHKAHIDSFFGSCLELLPTFKANEFDMVITSPPYCNRYDYTRTYALELAMLGASEAEIVRLRQAMVSCTVENREKDLVAINHHWEKVIGVVNNLDLLQEILVYMNIQKEQKLLNNTGIPRMIRSYFYEMACVIYELHRVMKKNGRIFMVNDNVRYSGISISVDLILSKIAEDLGFEIEKILVLPGSKGNSSQQMGVHGREVLRKCVYVWRKL